MDLITLALAKKYTDTKSSGGTSDYSLLASKPSINGVELSGNQTSVELGLNGVAVNSEDTTPSTLEEKITFKERSGLSSEIVNEKFEIGLVLDDSTVSVVETFPFNCSIKVNTKINTYFNWSLSGTRLTVSQNFELSNSSKLIFYILNAASDSLKKAYFGVYEEIYSSDSNSYRYVNLATTECVCIIDEGISYTPSSDVDKVINLKANNCEVAINFKNIDDRILLEPKKRYFVCCYASKSTDANAYGFESSGWGNRKPTSAISCINIQDVNSTVTGMPDNLDGHTVNNNSQNIYYRIQN